MSEQSNVGEETLTDYFLWQAERAVPFIAYQKFTRHQENAVTGADWEWWIVGRKGGMKIRVQAKRVRSESRKNYAGIAYNRQEQIKKLIESSESDNAYPVYAFYTPHLNGCELSQHSGKLTGVHIASAHDVYRGFFVNGNVNADKSALIALSCPIECVFCTNHNPREAISMFLDYEADRSEQVSPSIAGFHSEIPIHIEEFIAMRKRGVSIEGSIALRRSFASRFDEMYKDKANSLFVLDVRNDDSLKEGRLLRELPSWMAGALHDL